MINTLIHSMGVGAQGTDMKLEDDKEPEEFC